MTNEEDLTSVSTSVASIATGISALANSELLAIVLSTTLRNGHKYRLMVRRRSHATHSVETLWQTIGHSSGKKTLVVSGIVDSLEEHERLWIRGVAGLQTVTQILDGDVGVANDLAASVEVLGRRVVGRCGVGEGACGETLGLHRDGKCFAGWQVLHWLGGGDDGGDHVFRGRDLAHYDTVARSGFDLETVGESLPGTEVDEVVWVAWYMLGCCLS